MCFIGLYGSTIDEGVGERRAYLVGGLAGAALPAGLKGAGPCRLSLSKAAGHRALYSQTQYVSTGMNLSDHYSGIKPGK